MKMTVICENEEDRSDNHDDADGSVSDDHDEESDGGGGGDDEREREEKDSKSWLRFSRDDDGYVVDNNKHNDTDANREDIVDNSDCTGTMMNVMMMMLSKTVWLVMGLKMLTMMKGPWWVTSSVLVSPLLQPNFKSPYTPP